MDLKVMAGSLLREDIQIMLALLRFITLIFVKARAARTGDA